MASQSQARRHLDPEHDAEALKAKTADLFHDTLDEFRERTDDLKTMVSEYVKEKPFKALGIALISGVAMALLLKR